MKPRKPLSDDERAKARENYRKNRDKILDYQRSEEYRANLNARRRNSDEYREYNKVTQRKLMEEPENVEKRNESRRRSYHKNKDKELAKMKDYQQKNREKLREYNAEYMRKYRERKKNEQAQKDSDPADT